MADLIRKSTIEQGHDPRECVLVAYGGAGPTHAVFYGHEIGSKAILVLADSTVFSAEGMLTCDITHTAEVSRVVSTPFTDASLAGADRALRRRLEQRVIDQFALRGRRRARRSRWRARSAFASASRSTPSRSTVDPGTLDAAAGERVLERFVERYGQLYGEGALLLGGGNEVELHRVVGTRRIEPVAFPRARQRRCRRLRGAQGRAQRLLRAGRLHGDGGLRRRRAAAPGTRSTGRRSSSGWATASSFRRASARRSTAC